MTRRTRTTPQAPTLTPAQARSIIAQAAHQSRWRRRRQIWRGGFRLARWVGMVGILGSWVTTMLIMSWIR